MTNNIYIIKSLAPWMIDELLAFSELSKFKIIFLRAQDEFYQDEISKLKNNGVGIYDKPFKLNYLIKKLKVVIKFIFRNLIRFKPDYNFVLGLKSLVWFIRLDLSHFSNKSNIHAQFATQAAIVSILIKQFFNNSPDYSFTFHAYDIYFENKWFDLLVKNCKNAFSISEYNIDYVRNKFIDSPKIILSHLGVFRDNTSEYKVLKKNNSKIFTLGLISWFVEKKGIIFLLKAMLEFKSRGLGNIKLLLAGDGPLKEEFIEFIKKNNLMDSVNYIGKIKGEQKKVFFESIDVFVLPSVSLEKDKDGIPVVLMEAIASSLPVISTKVSGIPEICINDFNGLIVKQRNVDEIVRAVIFIYENKISKEKFSKNSLSLSVKYDIIKNSKNKINTLGWKSKMNN